MTEFDLVPGGVMMQGVGTYVAGLTPKLVWACCLLGLPVWLVLPANGKPLWVTPLQAL